MRLAAYIGRSLAFHGRSHLPVALGVITATATLTGALLVGDSMRASLRDVALASLGRVDHALIAQRFFRETIAADLARSATFKTGFAQACPVILLRGGVVRADTGARVDRITVWGADQRFFKLAASGDGDQHDRSQPPVKAGPTVILNESLAQQLGVEPGAEVLVRLGKGNPVSTETLLGRRDDTRLTLRLTVDTIIPAALGGDFVLAPGRSLPKNAWIPLSLLQRALKRPGRVNAILVEQRATPGAPAAAPQAALQRVLQQCLTLEDLGLRLRIDSTRGCAALESDRFLIEPAVEQAALAAAGPAGVTAAPVLTYLANTISAARQGTPTSLPTPPTQDHDPAPDPQSTIRNRQSVIPYSTVTALDTTNPATASLTLINGVSVPALRSGEMLLNEWAADDLQVAPGQRIDLTYYVTAGFGRLETRTSSFLLRGIVRMDEADPGFTPSYPGVTDAKNLIDWDPPFPVDLSLVRDKDEDYWDRYHAAPKAFISLDEGRRLWTDKNKRFGMSTSIRILPTRALPLTFRESQSDSRRASPVLNVKGAGLGPHGEERAAEANLSTATAAFRDQLRQRLNVARLGLSFDPVRSRALVASTGSTDFGMLFLAFSFFLILSALLLVALLFRLGAERRCREVGILLATGFSPKTVTRLLVLEGVPVAVIGAAIGLVAAMGYAWLMLAGLTSVWSQAVNAPLLKLHARPESLIVGFCASVTIALVSIAWSIRSLSRSSVRSLLAGIPGTDSPIAPRRRRLTTVTGVSALALAGMLILLSAFTEALPDTVGFFGGGGATMVAVLCAVKRRLDADRPATIRRAGRAALLRLGVVSAMRHPGRSLLTVGLIASATFIITAIEALHVDADADTTSRYAATGGFALLAESAIPIVCDLNTREGRDALGVSESATDLLDGVTVVPFRLRPGDETSCRDLYRPTTPRIVGAGDAMIDRGGFAFASTLAGLHDGRKDEGHNPWTLLRHVLPDGAVPVIGDESAVKWQLHLDLGKDVHITDEGGRDVRLRFVGLLAGSALQDELIVAESRFAEMFPSISGHAFFLIDVRDTSAPNVARTLEQQLHLFAFDVTPTAQRLGEYLAVQNTYLSTFQTLGGLGLVLGTVGLAVVLLRNVWERRGELALMRALGFSRAALGAMVWAENAALVVLGLAAGSVPALVAIAPHILTRPTALPWLSLGLTLGAVLVVGLGAGAAALAGALRAPLLPALRRE